MAYHQTMISLDSQVVAVIPQSDQTFEFTSYSSCMMPKWNWVRMFLQCVPGEKREALEPSSITMIMRMLLSPSRRVVRNIVQTVLKIRISSVLGRHLRERSQREFRTPTNVLTTKEGFTLSSSIQNGVHWTAASKQQTNSLLHYLRTSLILQQTLLLNSMSN